jgi:hypothetical protein
MRLITSKLSARHVPLILLPALLICVLLAPGSLFDSLLETVHAQRNSPPPVAQVGPASPLPVYVVNDPPPALPVGFVPGSSWKFTTWTVPSTLTFTATVQNTEGGWASLTLNTDPPGTSKWYYVPQMPGAWEPQ